MPILIQLDTSVNKQQRIKRAVLKPNNPLNEFTFNDDTSLSINCRDLYFDIKPMPGSWYCFRFLLKMVKFWPNQQNPILFWNISRYYEQLFFQLIYVFCLQWFSYLSLFEILEHTIVWSQWSWAVVQREKMIMAYDLHPVLVPYSVS